MAAIYKPTQAIQLLRSTAPRSLPIPSQKAAAARAAFSASRSAQATHNSSSSNNTSANDILSAHPAIPTRRRVTVTNDTGAVPWGQLSPGEKASRTVQQSFNLGVVLVGIVFTGAVGYIIFSDFISPNSKTAHFNRATTLIREHPECQKLLGPRSEISAHGESSWSRYAKNKFIHSTEEKDQWGTEHMRFKFFVEGPLNQGTVHCHLTKRPSQDSWEWCELAVNIKGQKTVWVERADGKAGSKVAPKIFGARWW